jgi:hypothetical protein
MQDTSTNDPQYSLYQRLLRYIVTVSPHTATQVNSKEVKEDWVCSEHVNICRRRWAFQVINQMGVYENGQTHTLLQCCLISTATNYITGSDVKRAVIQTDAWYNTPGVTILSHWMPNQWHKIFYGVNTVLQSSYAYPCLNYMKQINSWRQLESICHSLGRHRVPMTIEHRLFA